MHCYQQKLNRYLAQHATALEGVKQEKRVLQQAKEQLVHLTQAQELVQVIAEQVQNHACSQIASVVSRCLRAVFAEDAYEFKIDFQRKRGKTEARLLLCRDGLELEEPMDMAGGGVIDVAGFALRLACIMLNR